MLAQNMQQEKRSLKSMQPNMPGFSQQPSSTGGAAGAPVKKPPNVPPKTVAAASNGASAAAAFLSTGQNQSTAAPPSGDYITVVYFLPNEPTPFRTKFYGAKMDLRDFKAMLPRKQASFK